MSLNLAEDCCSLGLVGASKGQSFVRAVSVAEVAAVEVGVAGNDAAEVVVGP